MKKLIIIAILIGSLLISFGARADSIIDPGVAASFTNQMLPATTYSQNLTVGSIVALLVRAALGLLAIIFLILLIMAGFNWMTTGGDESKVKKARDTIKTAVIGLFIVLAAYMITYFIFSVLPFSVSTGPQGGANPTIPPH